MEGTGGYLFNDTTACKNEKDQQRPRHEAKHGDVERNRDGNAKKQNEPSSVPPPSLNPPMNQAKPIRVSSTTTKPSFN